MATQKFTIKELKIRIKDIPFEKQGKRTTKRRIYPIDFKTDLLSFHYETGRTINSISDELGLRSQVINKWKRELGKQRTAVIYGKGVRNDVRTKALAVQEHIQGIESSKLAVKYGVTQSTIYLWINKYEDKYEEYLDLSDGIMTIAKEEKQIFGDKNIEEIEQMLKDQNEALSTLLQNQHYTKAEIAILNKMKDKTSKNQADITTFKNTAKKLHIKL